MAVGWSREGDVLDQIQGTVEDGIQLARSRLSEGESLKYCVECEVIIPEERRKAIPGVRYCVRCQAEIEKQKKIFTPYNRRGSKDSQLK